MVKNARFCLWLTVMIYEVWDACLDIVITSNYHRGKLFNDDVYKDSVYKGLLAFTIIGYVCSFSLLAWYSANLADSSGEVIDGTALGLHSLNVVLEAFPQSVTAKFCFDHCPIKDGPSHLVPAFDILSGLGPFICFAGCLCWYCYNYGAKKRRIEMSIGLVFSLLSLVFAIFAFCKYQKNCS